MGNCQAAEAATVVIQHPAGRKVERIYWSVSAQEVMSSNPGHYVALVVASTTANSDTGATVKHLKLLRPDDTLLIGQVYRLISFEDVLKEFAAKRCVKLGKLLEKGGLGVEKRKVSGGSGLNPNPNPENLHSAKVEQQAYRLGSSIGRANARHHQLSGGTGNRPCTALQKWELELILSLSSNKTKSSSRPYGAMTKGGHWDANYPLKVSCSILS